MSKNEIVERPSDAGYSLMPLVSPADTKRAYNAYLLLCQSILIPYEDRIVVDGVVKQESDYTRFENRSTGEFKDHPNKSAWDKLAKAYGVSTEKTHDYREDHENKTFTYHYSFRAWRGDVSATADGSCTSNEKGKRRTIHETKATAETRARSRSISALIGFGQVSAEEIQLTQPPPPRRQAESNQAKTVKEPRKLPPYAS